MNIGEVKKVIEDVITDIRNHPIPVGISNRHLHLTQHDYDILFPNQPLTVRKNLKQPGHFAADQTVSLIGPKGQIDRVRILGPLRSVTQIELSQTDARTLGIKAPLRLSGKLDQTPGITLKTPHAELTLEQGVIIALRHIHMSPMEALILNVKQGDKVKVAIEGTARRTVFEEVLIRVAPDTVLEMHLDTDEANAADVANSNAYAKLLRE